MSEAGQTAEAAGKEATGFAFALDFLPLVVFFAANKFFGVIVGTAAFMVAITVAIAVARWKLGRVSPMQWLSALLVIGFGALTIWLNDERFIQLKPTIIYLGFAAVLLIGVASGRSMIRALLGAAFQGVSDEGWLKLSRNWGLFFLFLAAFNEVTRRLLDFDSWLTVKVWGVTAMSLAFTVAQAPMLLRHGLQLGEREGGAD